MENGLSRLESLHYRLAAQIACLAWAFSDLAGRPGLVFEMGLGHGRSFDHLRRHLPDREIYVFDRGVTSYPECSPEPAYMIAGELGETLPAAARRFAGQVALAHSDVGSFDAGHNARMAALVSAHLSPALADGALVLSDLPLDLPGTTRLALPAGARQDRYHAYRFRR